MKCREFEMKIREYEILEKIGQPGGMAVVYKAKHQSLEVIRAIKKLHFHLVSNSTIIQRFENEARALSILEHPNIVKVFDFFKEEDNYYLIMEYIDGHSLADILKKAALSEKISLGYMQQILSTLAFAHSKKILHRDIKPSNILINKRDVVKVVDFGIAKMMDRKGLTSTGLTIGSPWYMSPEQIAGKDLDERSDIYSLGITLFEMLTSQVPFNDTSEYKIYEMHQKTPVPSLKEIDKKFSTDLDIIIQKATAKKPKDRYQNAIEFAEAIDVFLALSGFGRASGATIADFDPSEYMTNVKTEKESGSDIDLGSVIYGKDKTTTTDKASTKIQNKKTKTKVTREDYSKKRTAYEQATVYQDVSDQQARSGGKSDLIDKKVLNGLHTVRKPFLSIKIVTIISFTAVLIIALSIWLLTDSSPEIMKVQPGEISNNSIQLTWLETEDAEYYQISRKSLNATSFDLIKKIPTNLYLDTTVIPGEEYQYQISAFEKDGDILALGEASIKLPEIEFGFLSKDTRSTEVSLSWNKINNIQNYRLYRRDNDSKSPEELNEIYRGNENSYTDNKLIPERSYSYLLKIIFKNQKEYKSAFLNVITLASVPQITAKFGELRVGSKPLGANVILDGRRVGKTPFTRKGLRVGSYKISVKKDGFSDYTAKVRIRTNKMTRISPTLVVQTGTLDIQARPYGTISVDGKVLKKDTAVQFKIDLPAGTHKVTIVHSGLAARWEEMMKISAGKSRKIIVDFTKMVRVTVTSTPWANIIVDRKATGQVTPKQIKVRVGLHRFEVQRDGYEMEGSSKVINVKENLSQPVEFKLNKK